MSYTGDANSITSSTLSTSSYTNTMDTGTLERAATILTKELHQIDPTEIIEAIRNLTIDPMTYKEPNPVQSTLCSGIHILASNRTNAEISQ